MFLLQTITNSTKSSAENQIDTFPGSISPARFCLQDASDFATFWRMFQAHQNCMSLPGTLSSQMCHGLGGRQSPGVHSRGCNGQVRTLRRKKNLQKGRVMSTGRREHSAFNFRNESQSPFRRQGRITTYRISGPRFALHSAISPRSPYLHL